MAVIYLLLVIVEVIFLTTNSLTDANPLYAENLCAAPCAARCSPQCLPNCCAGNAAAAPCAQRKQQFMVGSVEEGETEECTDKGFKSPTDSSEDPPGTITIPLPPTMYTPPKPGEEPKELPLPDFKLPASLLEGKMPDKSITLTPEAAGITAVPAMQEAAPPASVPAPAPAPAITKLPPAPPPPVPVAAPAYPPLYPKLPPVTSSEIPGRAKRLPPAPSANFAARPVVAAAPAPVVNFAKPPPIHVNLNAAAPNRVSAVGPSVGTVGIAAQSCAASPCESKPHVDPIAKQMEVELNSRYGKKH